MDCTYPLCNCLPASEFKSGVPILCSERDPAAFKMRRVDTSIAKQLQLSMELNARLKARLLRVCANMRAHQPDGSDVGWAVAIAADEALEEVLQDRDPPVWPIE